MFTLRDFVTESNRIEGVDELAAHDLMAHEGFLKAPVTIETLEWFVTFVATASLRGSVGMDVVVGNHRPMPGGPDVRIRLQELLSLRQPGR